MACFCGQIYMEARLHPEQRCLRNSSGVDGFDPLCDLIFWKTLCIWCPMALYWLVQPHSDLMTLDDNIQTISTIPVNVWNFRYSKFLHASLTNRWMFANALNHGCGHFPRTTCSKRASFYLWTSEHAFSVLDTILYDFLLTMSEVRDIQHSIHGRIFQISIYNKVMDQRYMLQLLKILLSLIRCTSHLLCKTMKSSAINRSALAVLPELAYKRKLCSIQLK